MIAVLQRVNRAEVTVDGKITGSCGKGLYILLGVESGDDETDAKLLSEKIAKLRIFTDEQGKMNRSLLDIGGEALVVSNFTLMADYSHGNRPSYFGGAEPAKANALYETFLADFRAFCPHTGAGIFGADMTTDLETDGPVTIVMHSSILRGKHK